MKIARIATPAYTSTKTKKAKRLAKHVRLMAIPEVGERTPVNFGTRKMSVVNVVQQGVMG